MRKFLKLAFVSLLLSASTGTALAEYGAKITLNSDRSWVTKQVAAKDGFLLSESGRFTVKEDTVKSIEFRFAGNTLTRCQAMFVAGEYTKMDMMLEEQIGTVIRYSYLPTNLGDYLVWQLRARYWDGKETEALQSIEALRRSPHSKDTRTAELYHVLILLDQSKVDEAINAYKLIQSPEEISLPMTRYIKGRIAFQQYRYRDAIKEISKILAFHSLDKEWMPAATWMESRIYLQTNQPAKASLVADELILVYSGTKWVDRGKEIKQKIKE